MKPEAARRSLGSHLLGLATALMMALAAGAVWCVVQLIVPFDLIACALVLGLVVAWSVRKQGFAHRVAGVAMACAATMLGCAYALYLLAAAKVASFLGIPMRATLTTIGPDMAAAVARADLSAWHVATLVVAIILSGWMAWRRA